MRSARETHKVAKVGTPTYGTGQRSRVQALWSMRTSYLQGLYTKVRARLTRTPACTTTREGVAGLSAIYVGSWTSGKLGAC